MARPPITFTPEQTAQILEFRKIGKSINWIAKQYGVSFLVMKKHLNKFPLPADTATKTDVSRLEIKVGDKIRIKENLRRDIYPLYADDVVEVDNIESDNAMVSCDVLPDRIISVPLAFLYQQARIKRR